MDFFELLRIGLDLVAVIAGCLQLLADKSFISRTGRPSFSSTTVAAGAMENFSVLLPVGRPSCDRRRQAWYHIEGILDGCQGIVNACGVCDDVRNCLFDMTLLPTAQAVPLP